MTSAKQMKLFPNEGKDCSGDSLSSDVSGGDRPLHYCFDLSGAQSYRFKWLGQNAADDDYAKFTYYSETGCSGDVTAVKVLCGVPGSDGGTCYNKHDSNAGSVFAETQGNRDCDFWDEGEKECNNQQTDRLGAASNPPCGDDNFPDPQPAVSD